MHYNINKYEKFGEVYSEQLIYRDPATPGNSSSGLYKKGREITWNQRGLQGRGLWSLYCSFR